MEYLNQFQASPYGNYGGQTGSQTIITNGEAMVPERAEALQKKKIFMAQQPPEGQGLLLHEDSRSHTTTHHSR